MKRIFKLIPAALALVALASCSNDDILKNDASSVNFSKSASAEIESYAALTRSAITEIDGKASTRKLVWSAGDAYKQFGGSNKSDKYELTAGAGTSSATFSFKGTLDQLNNNGDETVALFPYTEESNLSIDGKTITMTLPEEVSWASETVAEEGYTDGVVCNVPMFGIYNNAKLGVDFYYLTSLLKIDLKNLPKRTDAVIIKTDKPMGGVFTADLPEITQNDDTKYTYTGELPEFTVGNVFKGGENYTYECSFKGEKGWTNKTFFIPVPTGFYGVFNVYLSINNAVETTPFIQIGDEYRDGVGKEPIEWKRGKVRSLSKAFEINAGGSVNEVNSVLANSSFPETGTIIINVEPDTYFKYGATSGKEFIIPDALKERNIEVVIPSTMKIAADGSPTTLTIKPETAPLLAAANKGSFTLVGDFLTGHAPTQLIVNAPETTVLVDGATDAGAPLTAVVTLASKDGGFILGEHMTVEAADNALGTKAIDIKGGMLTVLGTITKGQIDGQKNATDIIVEGDVQRIVNNGKGDISVTEGSFLNIQNLNTSSEGAIEINKATTTANIIQKANGGITIDDLDNVSIDDQGTGAVVIKNVKEIKALSSTQAASLTIEGVTTNVSGDISYKGAGAFSLKNVTGTVADVTVPSASSFTIDNVDGTVGTVDYDGAGAFAVTNVDGNITKLDASAASGYTVTTFKGTITDLVYGGTGAVTITGSGDNAKFGTGSDAANIKGGNITVSAVKAGNFTQKGTGTLSISNSTLGEVKQDLASGNLTLDNVTATSVTTSNAAVEIKNKSNVTTLTAKDGKLTVTNSTLGTATNAKGVATLDNVVVNTSYTQSNSDKLTLKNNYGKTIKKVSLTGGAMDYEDTFITELANTSTKSTITGTKRSGIGTATGSLEPKTDKWDGSVCATVTDNIYTSASMAKLKDKTTTDAVKLYLDLDMNKSAQTMTAAKVSSFDGQNHKIENAKTATGIFADGGISVENLTLKNCEATAKANAGILVGTVTGSSTFKKVTVEGASVGTSTDYAGNAVNVGGFVGNVNASSKDVIFQNCQVKSTTLKGHYYMGGFIGIVTAAANVKFQDKNGGKNDTESSCIANSLTYDVQSKDGVWSTLKNGTVAPFIGSITSITTELNIYGEYDSFNRTTAMWNKNFLDNEAIKFYGTINSELNFIGYVPSKTAIAKYYLKKRTGFEADTSTGMTYANVDNSIDKSKILETEYNCYLIDSQW